jgi:branched-chain amino acid transport system substrate-binding protein
MHGYSGPVTAAAVKKQVMTVQNVPVPLSGGITFTCNGKAIPLLPSVCSSELKVGKVSSAGVLSGLQLYDPTPLFHV